MTGAKNTDAIRADAMKYLFNVLFFIQCSFHRALLFYAVGEAISL